MKDERKDADFTKTLQESMAFMYAARERDMRSERIKRGIRRAKEIKEKSIGQEAD